MEQCLWPRGHREQASAQSARKARCASHHRCSMKMGGCLTEALCLSRVRDRVIRVDLKTRKPRTVNSSFGALSPTPQNARKSSSTWLIHWLGIARIAQKAPRLLWGRRYTINRFDWACGQLLFEPSSAEKSLMQCKGCSLDRVVVGGSLFWRSRFV